MVWRLHCLVQNADAALLLGPHDADIFNSGIFVRDIKAAYGFNASRAALYRQAVFNGIWEVYFALGYELGPTSISRDRKIVVNLDDEL